MAVNRVLLGLMVDLEQRCDRLLAELRARRLHPAVTIYCEDITRQLEELRHEIRLLQGSNWLQNEPLYYLAKLEHQALYERIALIEGQAIPVLLGYDDHDHRFGQIVAALIREIGFPLDLTPIVTTKSDQYYWSHPELRLIGVPIGDIGGILGWPDLIHELGHLLLFAHPELLNDFTPLVNRHFKNERDMLVDIGGSERDNQWLALAQLKWGEKESGTWRVELAADSIATFFVGPSFGWQHVRLAANSGNDPYDPSPGQTVKDHPADQARLEGIVSMVRILGLKKDAEDIAHRWSSLLRDGLYKQPPQGFQSFYPQPLLEALAQNLYDGCKNLGLRPFIDQEGRGNPGIVTTIDQAWRMFNSDPTRFKSFEQDAIGHLHSILGIDSNTTSRDHDTG